MPLFQIPAVRLPLPETLWQRKIRPGGVTRYHVVSDLEGPNGKAHFEYDMALDVEKPLQKKVDYGVVVKMTNLEATFDGTVAPSPTRGRSKLFCAIPIKLSATGAPTGISAGGPITTYAIPLMVFTLPDQAPEETGRFKVPKIRIEPIGSLSGSGQIAGIRRGEFEISLGLDFAEPADAPAFTSLSWFDFATGDLRQAAGRYLDSNGTLTFSISRA